MRAATNDNAAAPVLVGGTGRSGTTVLGDLIGRHSRYACVPIEARFHAEPLGVPAFVNERISAAELSEFMRAHWSYELDHPRGGQRGLSGIVDRDALAEILARFETQAGRGDRDEAARRLIHDVLDRTATAAEKPAWVEMTPINVLQARVLARVLPDARFVHIVRDGRDTACSLVAQGWIPTIQRAIEWWGPRFARTLAAARAVPPERVHTVALERLVRDDREREYRRLLDFLALEDEPPIRTFFEEQMTAQNANLDRWRRELDPETRELVSQRYAELKRAAEAGSGARRSDSTSSSIR